MMNITFPQVIYQASDIKSSTTLNICQKKKKSLFTFLDI